jgi:nucleoside-diphosphate-sugar epimerase
MRILVTGGLGFIGSHLVDLLLKDRSNYVHVLDNLSSSPLPLECVLDEIGRPDNLGWTLMDVASIGNIAGGPYQQVYHLASIVGPAGVLPQSGSIAHSIISDSMAVADAVERWGARLVDVSTSEVYGGGESGLCSEGMPRVLRGASARVEYAAGKAAAEIALLNRCARGLIDIRIVRPFNVAGKRQSGVGGFVLPRFVGQALSGEPLTVFGDGTQLRAFTDVRDIANGLEAAMEHGKPGGVYNLGNLSNRCSIDNLAKMVLNVCHGWRGTVNVDPSTIYGPAYSEAEDKFPGVSVLELDWNPSIALPVLVDSVRSYMAALPPEIFDRLRGKV